MANRHLSRSIALQTLFEWDFNQKDSSGIEEILERDTAEFAPGAKKDDFAVGIVKGVVEKQKEIDSIIEKAAPEWPLNQIAAIDRNVLRIGLYELLFGDRAAVPPKVAINEAIELAKNFGGETSGKFVNGVLGTVYREIGEPGKNDSDSSSSRSRSEHFGFRGKTTGEKLKNLPREDLAGAVIYRREKDGKVKYALVHDVFGYWTLSKGHVEEGESVEEGAKREAKEELGIKKAEISGELGENEYIASDPEKGPVRKRVAYFLASTPDEKLKLGARGGLDDACWFLYEEIAELKMYDDVRTLLEKANNILSD